MPQERPPNRYNFSTASILMKNAQIDNVDVLIEVAIAHRKRLIERKSQSDPSDVLILETKVRLINQWLVEFAYERLEAGRRAQKPAL